MTITRQDYELTECYWCGEAVLIDSNNQNENKDDCFFGWDSLGQQRIACTKHISEGDDYVS